MKIIVPKFDWKQIDGDMDPGKYGGTIASADGNSIELLKIQPVREYVGDGEALEVGFPFWTREAWFDASDLNPDTDEVRSALSYIGMDPEDLEENYSPDQRALVIASALLDYGHADEGPGGWAEDVIGDRQVEWWGGKGGWEYIADEDEEFRELQIEAEGPDEEGLYEAVVIRDSPRGGYDVVYEGKLVGHVIEWQDAVDDATETRQRQGEYWPPFYYVDERGTVNELDDDGDIRRSW